MAVLACTRSNRRFCIPKPLCGESAPVSTRSTFASRSASLEPVVPLGFFSGGFSSTAGYVPGNEALVFRRERLGTLQVDHLPRALSVFIRITPASLPADHRKPFGFGSGRPRQRLSAPSALKRRVTTSVPPPGAGQNTRK